MPIYYFHSKWEQEATGTGNLDKNGTLEVKITNGKVSNGSTYTVKEGARQNVLGNFHCKSNSNKGDIAIFQRATNNLEYESAYMNNVLAMQEYLASVQKKVTIQISDDALGTLKENKYKLCFAKKVGDHDYNVVWQSFDKYLSTNEFSWTPQYQLFATNAFNEGVKVVISTTPMTIGLGQRSTLNAAGVLQSPVSGGPDTGFAMLNEYGGIHPGVNQLSTGVDGVQTSSPIYVAPTKSLKGEVELKPVEKVLIWFQQNIETSTMFSEARSNSIEIDLTDANSATRRYDEEE